MLDGRARPASSPASCSPPAPGVRRRNARSAHAARPPRALLRGSPRGDRGGRRGRPVWSATRSAAGWRCEPRCATRALRGPRDRRRHRRHRGGAASGPPAPRPTSGSLPGSRRRRSRTSSRCGSASRCSRISPTPRRGSSAPAGWPRTRVRSPCCCAPPARACSSRSGRAAHVRAAAPGDRGRPRRGLRRRRPRRSPTRRRTPARRSSRTPATRRSSSSQRKSPRWLPRSLEPGLGRVRMPSHEEGEASHRRRGGGAGHRCRGDHDRPGGRGEGGSDRLTGFQEVPAISTDAGGKFRAKLRTSSQEIRYELATPT